MDARSGLLSVVATEPLFRLVLLADAADLEMTLLLVIFLAYLATEAEKGEEGEEDEARRESADSAAAIPITVEPVGD